MTDLLVTNRHVCLHHAMPADQAKDFLAEYPMPLAHDGRTVLFIDAVTGQACELVGHGHRLSVGSCSFFLPEGGNLVCEDSPDVPVPAGMWYLRVQRQMSGSDTEPRGFTETSYAW